MPQVIITKWHQREYLAKIASVLHKKPHVIGVHTQAFKCRDQEPSLAVLNVVVYVKQ